MRRRTFIQGTSWNSIRRTARFARYLFLCLAIPFAVHAATKDANGCKDSPLISRFPGSFIEICEDNPDNAFTFNDIGAKKEPKKIEGEYHYTWYDLPAGASVAQVTRNLTTAFKTAGWAFVGDSGSGGFTVHLGKAWIREEVNGGGDYKQYIVIETQLTQDMVATTADALSSGLAATGHSVVNGILFDTGKAEVKPESAPALQEVVKLLIQDANLKVYVVGHTDNVGALAANMDLSRRRAEAVVQTLTAQYGVAADRLQAYGDGPYAPLASNDSDDGRALNRRVELVKQGAGPRPAAASQAAWRESRRRNMHRDTLREAAGPMILSQLNRGAAILCLCLFFAAGTPAQEPGAKAIGDLHKPIFTTFDAAGAGTGNGQGTFADSINTAGDIAGLYIDGNNTWHGFVRAANGTLTTFDAPGAVSATFPVSINAAGTIAGYYADVIDTWHGFVRAASGAITTFDAPGAGTGAGYGTFANSINAAGHIAGYYSDTNNVWHGFVRSAKGVITTFDAPGAGTGANLGTLPAAINAAGDIAGNYLDTNTVNHGFVRTADGTIISFDAPGAGTSLGGGTNSVSINSAGTIAGYSYQDGYTAAQGFVRAANGTITTFGAAGAGTGELQGTFPAWINAEGTITGEYTDADGVLHGLVRDASGVAITSFQVPGAGSSAGQGTFGYGIGNLGAIAGYYVDASNVSHGFVLTP